MENSENTIQQALDLTLTDSNLTNLGGDILEIGIDAILKDGLLKDIPIVSTIVNLSRTGANIQDRLFLKKLLFFLNQIKDVPAHQRKQMIESIDSSKEYRVRVGEKLMYIIDSSHDHETSELISVVFRAYLEGRISYEDFLLASSSLNKLSIRDFRWFVKERVSYSFDIDDVGSLLGSGIFELWFDDINVDVENAFDPETNQLRGDRFKTNVEGGLNVNLSRAGEVLLEVFCSTYKPRRSARL